MFSLFTMYSVCTVVLLQAPFRRLTRSISIANLKTGPILNPEGSNERKRRMRVVAVFLIACLVSPAGLQAKPSDRSNWSRVRDLDQDSPVRVLLRNGGPLVSRVARVDAQSITLLDVSQTALSKDERREIYRALAKSLPPRLSLRGGTLDLDSVTRTVPRDEVQAIYRLKKGRSVLGTVIGIGIGFFIGVVLAVKLGFKECGASCTEDKIGIVLSLLGLPTLGGVLGYYVGSGDRLVYQGSSLPSSRRPNDLH